VLFASLPEEKAPGKAFVVLVGWFGVSIKVQRWSFVMRRQRHARRTYAVRGEGVG